MHREVFLTILLQKLRGSSSFSRAVKLSRQFFDKRFYTFSIAVNKHIAVLLHFARNFVFIGKAFHIFFGCIF